MGTGTTMMTAWKSNPITMSVIFTAGKSISGPWSAQFLILHRIRVSRLLCRRYLQLAHLWKPVRSWIGHGDPPNQIYLVVFHAYHNGVQHNFGFLKTWADV